MAAQTLDRDQGPRNSISRWPGREQVNELIKNSIEIGREETDLIADSN